ncbi:MAG: ATPase, T2SS/T4P/T4SS family [Candidatus Moranbacteria bacterium]|nr:ATPase, T2SS/T4P/T4SS family [Candidatus Moranbacteria bacterium]
MRIGNQQLKEFLLDAELVDPKVLEQKFQDAEKTGKQLGDLLLEAELVDEAELGKMRAYILGIPYVDLGKNQIDPEILQIIPEPIAKKHNIVAFEKTGGELRVAMLHPDDLQTIDFIKKKTGLKIVPCIASREALEAAIKQYEKSLKAEFGDIIDTDSQDLEGVTTGIRKEGDEEGDDKDQNLAKVAEDLPVVRVVDTLLKHAILQSASDIHIEPDEKEVRVRYRIDGILHEAMTLPKQVLPGIVARIKVLSNLKLDEHRLPQDGRFKIEKEGYKISFRVSILPIFDGEKIVMRLLDESSKGLTLEMMGFQPRPLEIIHREINKPNGMILVTGPTGSGKTTTLYTVLDILNVPEVNISTAEDPVEYRMSGVNQTQIKPKINLTFAATLRSLLRQDPDIIMVGEIRDQETMEIAMHAAMTGHLVLSTLHTNSAAATLPRLLDMGAEPFLVASTVNVIIAQRLVRKLCPECREEYKINEKELATLRDSYNMDEILEFVKSADALKGKIKPKDTWTTVSFFRKKGCERCSDGYKGRMGIYEVLEMDESIRKLVSQAAATEVIEKQAKENGMSTMVEDGFLKALQGITSVEEVLRVTKE